jgi:prepilin-type N-terminal cleavage/methylation domain-containing protein
VTMDARRLARGFTLLEICVVVAMLSLMSLFVSQILLNTIRGRDTLTEDLEGPKMETAILDEFIRDLRFVFFRPLLRADDAGFWGRNRTINGHDADRIDFMTCRQSRLAELEDTNQSQVNAPVIEVGWACRPSDTDERLLELWRREDYFVDDEPTDGGKFNLVSDKIYKFDLRYYPPTEDRAEGDNGLDEWDSKVQHKLPYAIVVSLEYFVQPPSKEKDLPPRPGNVRRIILLTPARSIVPDAAMGMDSGMTSMR